MGKQWKLADLFFGASKSLQMVTAAMKLKDAYSRSLPLMGSQVMGCGGFMLPEEHFARHSIGVAPPSFFLLSLC